MSATLSCGDSGNTINRGSQCTQVLRAFCDRAGGDCQIIPSDQIAACVQSGVNSCCAGACSAAVVSTQSDIDTCVANVEAAACSSLDVTDGGMLPSSCQGVVMSADAVTRDPDRLQATSPAEHAGALISR